MITSYFIYLFTIIVFWGNTSPAGSASRVDILPYYQEAAFTPHWFSSKESIPDSFHQIPEFDLIDQTGQPFTKENVSDKIYVADFFFTSCPGICPTMTRNMAKLQEKFLSDPEIILLSHSVTPEYDSPDILAQYAEIKAVKAGKWFLLTGDREEIYTLGRDYYFVEEDLGEGKSQTAFLHTENFILVDQSGYLRGIYNGLSSASVKQLIADIYTLKREFTQ